MTGTGARQHAMERSVEVDKFHFLVLARESSAKAHRRRSFRAIQGRARRHQRNARKECLWTASSPTGSLGDPVQFLVARDSANVQERSHQLYSVVLHVTPRQRSSECAVRKSVPLTRKIVSGMNGIIGEVAQSVLDRSSELGL